MYNALRNVIDKLDQRRAQVHVEVLIAEVTSAVAAEFGIQWQDLTGINRQGANIIGGTNFGGVGANIINSAQNIGTIGQGLNIGVVRGTMNIPGVGTVLNLGALARALENDQRANAYSFGSPHAGIVQFCMSDGSVRAISTAISTTVLGALTNRKDGLVVGEF